jgi:hypothetical protein
MKPSSNHFLASLTLFSQVASPGSLPPLVRKGVRAGPTDGDGDDVFVYGMSGSTTFRTSYGGFRVSSWTNVLHRTVAATGFEHHLPGQ